MQDATSGKRSGKANKIRSALAKQKKIIHEVVLLTRNEEEAFEKEKFLIKFYGRKDNKTGILTNHTDGGEGTSGYIQSKESRARISASKIGKRMSDQSIEKMRKTKQGKVPTAALAAAISANTGSTHSPDRVTHRNALNKRAVDMWTLTGEYVCSFDSGADAAKELNVSKSVVSRAINHGKAIINKNTEYKLTFKI